MAGSMPPLLSDRRSEVGAPDASGMGYRGALLFGLVVLAVFFGGFGTWAALAPLESAAVATGRVVVEGNRRTVQHLEGGIIGEILVREGSIVEAGDALIVLDETQSRSMYGIVHGRRLQAAAREARLLAERDGLDTIAFPAWLVELARSDSEIEGILAAQRRILASNRDRFESQAAILKKRSDQFREEIVGLQAEIRAADQELVHIREELEDVRFLVERGLGRKARLLALQRQEAEITGRRARNVAAIARARQSISESELRISDLESTRLNEVVQELREVQAELGDLRERGMAAEDVLTRTVIRAPVSGEVVNLRVFTPGGVIAPGEAVLDIVPLDETRIIQAQVDPNDIDSVYRGLDAKIRLSSLSARITPTLDGVVETVSADRLVDERTGRAFYETRIRLKPGELAKLGGVSLYPGMPAEVMIITGTRTALDYLIRPISGTISRGMRED